MILHVCDCCGEIIGGEDARGPVVTVGSALPRNYCQGCAAAVGRFRDSVDAFHTAAAEMFTRNIEDAKAALREQFPKILFPDDE